MHPLHLELYTNINPLYLNRNLGSFQYHSKLDRSLENTVYRVAFSFWGNHHGEMILEFLNKSWFWGSNHGSVMEWILDRRMTA